MVVAHRKSPRHVKRRSWVRIPLGRWFFRNWSDVFFLCLSTKWCALKEVGNKAYVMRITWLGRTALYCYSVITIGLGCIPLFKESRNGGRGRKKKKLTTIQIFLEKITALRWRLMQNNLNKHRKGQKEIWATTTNDVILKPSLPVGQMPKVDGNLTAIYGRNVTLHCPADDIVDGNRVSWDQPRDLKGS